MMQTFLTFVLIASAVSYIAFSTFRRLRGKKAGCGGKCACPSTSPAAAKQDLVSLDTGRLRQANSN